MFLLEAIRMAAQFTQSEIGALDRFPKAARDFCDFVDKADDYDRKYLFGMLPIYLAKLCEIAVQLPNVEPATAGTDYTEQEVRAHTEEWSRISEKLRIKFGSLDSYWEIFDPMEKEEPVLGSLANDIAETYLDLIDALRLPLSGLEQNDIYWDWKQEFQTHWSRHASSALKVMLFTHRLLE
jgi:uncharacterized protein DUF5063